VRWNSVLCADCLEVTVVWSAEGESIGRCCMAFRSLTSLGVLGRYTSSDARV